MFGKLTLEAIPTDEPIIMWTLAVVGLVAGIWVATTPEGLASMGPPSVQENYVNEAFASYYDPGASFAAMVWTNNAWISAQAVALGITGVWVPMILFSLLVAAAILWIKENTELMTDTIMALLLSGSVAFGMIILKLLGGSTASSGRAGGTSRRRGARSSGRRGRPPAARRTPRSRAATPGCGPASARSGCSA